MNYNKPLLSEQLRPIRLADLCLQEGTMNYFERMVQNRTCDNMLLYGRSGIGKTSAARILMRELNADVYEINGSFNDGDKTMVRNIESFATSVSLQGRIKICFIDEADYMSKDVQASLRYIIENSSLNTRYILTANDERKLTDAMKSRCKKVCFDVAAIDAKHMIELLVEKCSVRLAELGYNIDKDRITKIAHIYFPDMREIANRLEMVLH